MPQLLRHGRPSGVLWGRFALDCCNRLREHADQLETARELVNWRRHAEALSSGGMRQLAPCPQEQREQWKAALESVASFGAPIIQQQLRDDQRRERERIVELEKEESGRSA